MSRITSETAKVTFCVRGVSSPLLSNIYLNVLDAVWTRKYAQLGVLVRYADDCAPRRRGEEAVM
jgi:retron-type reverse transcriptase